jgi:hypothetical protein
MAGTKFIKYTAFPGIVSERAITREDFKALGIDHDTVAFNRGNRYMVDASDFPAEVLAVFEEESDFTVSESDKAPALMDKGAGDERTGSPLPSVADTPTNVTSTAGEKPAAAKK